MRQGFLSPPLVLTLFLLVLQTLPGDGNQGSATGSCSCNEIPHGVTPPPSTLDHIRKHLRTHDHCRHFIRFHLRLQSVCGEAGQQWVRELVSCFDNKECGNGHGKNSHHHQKHLPHASTQMPMATARTHPDTSTFAQIRSTQQSTFPSEARSLNRELTHPSESTALTSGYQNTAFTSGYDLEARPEAGANKKQQENEQQKEKPGASAGTAPLVPVLSLLAIVFLLTAAMVYVLCNRRRHQQCSSADVQLRYALVNPDSGA
ncbi:C-X-C motif chemokine 16 [Sigmodon hispidus]